MTTILSKVDAGVSIREGFPLQTDRTALLIVDVQEYVWLANTAHDHFCNTFHAGLERIKALSKEFRLIRDDVTTKSGCEIIFTYYQSLTRNRRDVSLDLKLSSAQQFVNIPGPDASNIFLEHCKPNTIEGKGDITISKTSSSVFQSTNIDYVLRNLGIEQIVVAGHLTDRGIEAAVRDASDLGYFVTVAEDACTAQTPQQHNIAILNMRRHARIKSAASILQELRMDFAEKHTGSVGTSVLENKNTSEMHAASSVVDYLRSQGFGKAAEKVEHHFIGGGKGGVTDGTFETASLSVPVDTTFTVDRYLKSTQVVAPDVKATSSVNCDPRQGNSNDPVNDPMNDPDVFEGSSSSFLSIENEESLQSSGRLGDDCGMKDSETHDPCFGEAGIDQSSQAPHVFEEAYSSILSMDKEELVYKEVHEGGHDTDGSADLHMSQVTRAEQSSTAASIVTPLVQTTARQGESVFDEKEDGVSQGNISESLFESFYTANPMFASTSSTFTSSSELDHTKSAIKAHDDLSNGEGLQNITEESSFDSLAISAKQRSFHSQPDHCHELMEENLSASSVGSPCKVERISPSYFATTTETEVPARPSSLRQILKERATKDGLSHTIPEHEACESDDEASTSTSRFQRRTQEDPPANRYESQSFIFGHGDTRIKR